MKSFWTRARRAGRIAVKAGWALLDTHHPVLVHIVPMRRCNLSCAYCNEYDAVSQPVPLAIMLRRLDKLASLGTAMITVSGGEPLMHPELDAMIVRMRERGMVSSLITNGYYLISYYTKKPQGERGFQKVNVAVKNRDFRIRARQGFSFGD